MTPPARVLIIGSGPIIIGQAAEFDYSGSPAPAPPPAAGARDQAGARAPGTPSETIRRAEDRDLFRRLLTDIGEPLPESAAVTTIDEAKQAAKERGLPLGGRPAST